MKKLILLFLGLGFYSCSSTRQKDDWQLRKAQAKTVQLDVPFIAQKSNECGPTTMTMLARYLGKKETYGEIKEMVMSPKARGSFQQDMIAASRRLGLTPYKVKGFDRITQYVHFGHPVLVYQDIGNIWVKNWHFALVVGYNYQKKTLLLHSNQEKYLTQDIDEFLESWSKGDEWAYVVTTPNNIPVDTTYEEALDNALVFEKLKKEDDAVKLYQAMITKWPNRYESYAGMANLYFSKGEMDKARYLYSKALELSPNHQGLQNNYQYLQTLN